MKNLTRSQKELVSNLRALTVPLPRNTKQIREDFGDVQAYESHLRDRLFRLAAKGVLRYTEFVGPRGGVKSRVWEWR